jgi:hypothetical protein
MLTGIVDPGLREVVIQGMDKKFKNYYEKDPKVRVANENALDYGLKLTGL